MAMTQIAFLKKAEIPTNKQIQEIIQGMGYDFKIIADNAEGFLSKLKNLFK